LILLESIHPNREVHVGLGEEGHLLGQQLHGRLDLLDLHPQLLKTPIHLFFQAIESPIVSVKALLNGVESLIVGVKALLNGVESLIVGVESLIVGVKSLIVVFKSMVVIF